jgi:redox-sensitive bicupin YhaK (pirin superfamily)
MNERLRPIARVVTSHRQAEGGGFIVRRPFPGGQLDQLDPFLLLDEMGPVDYAPGQAVGAPDHPHRGFETVTYLLDGSMEHRDSTGGHAVIVPGGVQWMTAGAGVVHSELPVEAIVRDGGRVHGFQLWVNLPARSKMIPPSYRMFGPDEFAIAELAHGGRVRVLAGDVGGVHGPVEPTTPVTYAHVTLGAGDELVWTPSDTATALVHVFGGAATINGREAVDGQMVVTEHEPGRVVVRSDAGAELLVLGGEPLHEPIARYGPFVMNDRAQLQQAFEDYEAGRLGSIPPIVEHA